jgi:hypothetical protein
MLRPVIDRLVWFVSVAALIAVVTQFLGINEERHAGAPAHRSDCPCAKYRGESWVHRGFGIDAVLPPPKHLSR